MMERVRAFENYQAFAVDYAQSGRLLFRQVGDVVADIRRHGLTEPLTNRTFPPNEIEIDPDPRRMHVSIRAGKFNCRVRVGLLALRHAIEALPHARRSSPKILGAEGVTEFAKTLRGLFPYYLGTEYLPTEEEREGHYPIPHLDLMDIHFEEESFDLFYSAHVLEHVLDVRQAIQQIARIIRPGGLLVSTFPFRRNRETTVVKARLLENGETQHLMEPEYHGNPVRPEDGSLVFQLPGWDALDMCRDAGLTEACFVQFTSAKHGIVGPGEIGSFVLMARKPGVGEPEDARRIKEHRWRAPKA